MAKDVRVNKHFKTIRRINAPLVLSGRYVLRCQWLETPSKLKGVTCATLGFILSLGLAYLMNFLITYFELDIYEFIKIIFVVIICIPFIQGVSVLSRSLSSKKSSDTNI